MKGMDKIIGLYVRLPCFDKSILASAKHRLRLVVEAETTDNL